LNGIIRTDTDVDELRGTVGQLARQVMLQQLFLEERIRSDGDSGIKQCRKYNYQKTNPFYTGICCSLETKRDACMYFQYLI
jgi:hypothetical protein